MQRLLRDSGFRYRGNVLCDEHGHDPRRQAYEKIIKARPAGAAESAHGAKEHREGRES